MIPSVSVILVSYRASRTLPTVLDALAGQTVRPQEVVLVDSGDDGIAHWVERHHPAVRLYRSARRLFPGDARNLALQHATGDVIAFLDADCVPAEDWLERILVAHLADGPSIVGGSVANGAKGVIGWASYFCEFSAWMPDQAKAPMPDVPTCSLSTSRRLLLSQPFVMGTYCSDTAWNWAMGRRGEAIRFEPAIRVTHLGHTRPLPWLRKNAMHGRALARVRVADKAFTRARCAAFAAGSFVLPWLLTWRTMRRVLRGRVYTSELLRSLPLVFLGHIIWSAGECAGYAEGLFRESTVR
jgi:GT2 family glycosyltransferase